MIDKSGQRPGGLSVHCDLTLFQKIAWVRDRCSGIEKGGYNESQKFAYVSWAELVNYVRPFLGEAGLVIVPHLHSDYNMTGGGRYETEFKGQRQLKKEDFVLVAPGHFDVIDADSGHCYRVEWLFKGVDSHEKDIGKMLSYGLKYFLIELFEIPVGVDDPDARVADEPQTPPPAYKDPSKVFEKCRAAQTTEAVVAMVEWINKRLGEYKPQDVAEAKAILNANMALIKSQAPKAEAAAPLAQAGNESNGDDFPFASGNNDGGAK